MRKHNPMNILSSIQHKIYYEQSRRRQHTLLFIYDSVYNSNYSFLILKGVRNKIPSSGLMRPLVAIEQSITAKLIKY